MNRIQKVLFFSVFFCLSRLLYAEPAVAQTDYGMYACAFSSIFCEQNGVSYSAFDPADGNKTAKNKCITLLQNNWNISSSKTLSEYADSVDTLGARADYNRLSKILYNNPRLSVQGVLYTFCLPVCDGTKLFFVLALNNTLGSAGINAWEYAQLISIYRCALGAGYITQDEALKKISPLVDTLKRECANWEDFAAHYSAGAQYSLLCAGTHAEQYKACSLAWEKSKKKLPLSSLVLAASLPRGSRALTISDVAYALSEKAKAWENVQRLDSLAFQFNEKDFQTVETLKKQFPTVPCVWYMSAQAYFTKKTYRRALAEFEALDRLLKSVRSSSDLYQNIYTGYALAALASVYPQKAVYAISRLSEKKRKEPYSIFLSARCNMELTGTSADIAENKKFRKNAESGFAAAEKAGYELPPFVKEWLAQKQDEL